MLRTQRTQVARLSRAFPVGQTGLMHEADVREAIRLLRGVITAANNGELDASPPNARVLVRKLEGALLALELIVDADK